VTTANISYQSIATAIAITSVDGLGDGAWSGSALVDNQTNKYLDALVGGSVQVGTVPAGGGTFDIYLVGSWDGVEFTAGVDGGDVAITWGTTGSTHVGGEKDVLLLDSITVDATDDDNDVVWGPFSVAAMFDGIMPLEWALVFENNTGATMHATGTNNHAEYTGIEIDNV